MNVDKLHIWKQTKVGLLAFGLIEIALAYVLASLAIDTGSIWFYVTGIILIILALRNFWSLLVAHGKQR